MDYRALRAMIVSDLRRGGERELAALIESDETSDDEIEAIRQRMFEIDFEQRGSMFHLDQTKSMSVQSLTVAAARDVFPDRRGGAAE